MTSESDLWLPHTGACTCIHMHTHLYSREHTHAHTEVVARTQCRWGLMEYTLRAPGSGLSVSFSGLTQNPTQ